MDNLNSKCCILHRASNLEICSIIVGWKQSNNIYFIDIMLISCKSSMLPILTEDLRKTEYTYCTNQSNRKDNAEEVDYSSSKSLFSFK